MSKLFHDYLRLHAEQTLQQEGFARRGRRGYLFARMADAHTSVVYFRRSDSRDAQGIVFTVELGVWSQWLHEFFKTYDHPFIVSGDFTNGPTFQDCHWRERLGFLLDRPRDVWWTFSNADDFALLDTEMLEPLLQVGVPKLISLMSDRALLDEFTSDQPAEVTISERLFYQTALLVAFGQNAELELRIQQLRGTRQQPEFQRAVNEHVRALEALPPPKLP